MPLCSAATSERESMEEGRSWGLDGAGGSESGGGGAGMVDWGSPWLRPEVGRDRREMTVDVKPGTRRTTSVCMLCVFCEPLSMNGTNG